MWKHIVLFLFCLLTFLNKINADDNIQLSNTKSFKLLRGRIVNGTRAVLTQFPQQVSLRRRFTQNHFCGGTILTPEWILSAAHCMFDRDNNTLKAFTILVVAGEIVLKNTNRAHAWSEVTELIIHEEFDNATLANDIALLKLKSPFAFDDRVRPAVITPKPVKALTFCQVCGWGYPKHGVEIISSYLMYVDVPVMSRELCEELWNGYIVPEGTFCAGYLEGGRDACTGDSGGGLICNGFLTGFVSGGENCAKPRTPGLYSDVYFFVPWIKKYVNLEQVSSKL